MVISKKEQSALNWLKEKGGLVPETTLDADEKDFNGDFVGFSKKTFDSLVKKGLVVFDEDESGVFCGDYILFDEVIQ
jgi:hypothetical protein